MVQTETRTVEAVSGATDLAGAARSFVPRIRELARAMERNRRLDDDLVVDMEAAGLFSVVVPKRWGGAGLDPIALNEVVEIIGTADCSTAWVTGFYNLHNWFLCHFPMQVQERLFADAPSVPCAAVFSPPSGATRVDGGYVVTGRWGYATGILHATHALVPAMVDDTLYWFIVPRRELEVFDDWDMAAMAATGSVSIAATSVFVPEECGLPFSTVTSAADHPGAVHEEEVYRFPFSALTLATVSLYVGALDAAVELAREGLQKSSGPPGPKRIERAAMRTRWINAYEAARVVRLVRDAAAHEALEIARRGTAPTMEEEAREQLHIQFIRQTVKNTLRDLVDSNGTSTHKADNQLRRASGDIAMLSTHALNGEYDVAMDRNARWLLGLGLSAGDPGARLT